uniref:Uncharacterized protein n=1 Tax=Ceratitis capitata TaxID=7213 RepID=W8C7G1_CERCA
MDKQQQHQLTGQLLWSKQKKSQNNNNSKSKDFVEDKVKRIIHMHKDHNNDIGERYEKNIPNTTIVAYDREVIGSGSGITTVLKPQMKAASKYKYIRNLVNNDTQYACKIASAKGERNEISGKSRDMYKNNSSLHELTDHDLIPEKRLVRRSIRVQHKFSNNKFEHSSLPPTSKNESPPPFTLNQYRKVNFKNIIKGSTVGQFAEANSTFETRMQSLPVPTTLPSLINQYRVVRNLNYESSRLNTVQSQWKIKPLPKENEHVTINETFTERKVCNSFVITKSNRATVATDIIDYS